MNMETTFMKKKRKFNKNDKQKPVLNNNGKIKQNQKQKPKPMNRHKKARPMRRTAKSVKA